VVIGGGCAI
jgi:hypothetical protein